MGKSTESGVVYHPGEATELEETHKPREQNRQRHVEGTRSPTGYRCKTERMGKEAG